MIFLNILPKPVYLESAKPFIFYNKESQIMQQKKNHFIPSFCLQCIKNTILIQVTSKLPNSDHPNNTLTNATSRTRRQHPLLNALKTKKITKPTPSPIADKKTTKQKWKANCAQALSPSPSHQHQLLKVCRFLALGRWDDVVSSIYGFVNPNFGSHIFHGASVCGHVHSGQLYCNLWRLSSLSRLESRLEPSESPNCCQIQAPKERQQQTAGAFRRRLRHI